MLNDDENTLRIWGIERRLRRNILTTILSLLIAAVVFLYWDGNRSKKQYQDKLEKQNAQMLEILIPSIQKVNKTVNAVDTLAKRADSTLTVINNQHK